MDAEFCHLYITPVDEWVHGSKRCSHTVFCISTCHVSPRVLVTFYSDENLWRDVTCTVFIAALGAKNGIFDDHIFVRPKVCFRPPGSPRQFDLVIAQVISLGAAGDLSGLNWPLPIGVYIRSNLLEPKYYAIVLCMPFVCSKSVKGKLV
jgi:hypothetical protein